MEDPIAATMLNDFIFCPASIYFHRFYDGMENRVFQCTDQTNGTFAHKNVDEGKYSTSKHVITGYEAYSEKYGLICKIDIYDSKKKLLVERKKKIKQIYDGYIFQLYAQYFCMLESGFDVQKLQLRSVDDNKVFDVKLPKDDKHMLAAFEETVDKIINFDINSFKQSNVEKCRHCIYESACDRTLL